jgi:hypothetical protein
MTGKPNKHQPDACTSYFLFFIDCFPSLSYKLAGSGAHFELDREHRKNGTGPPL